MHPKRKRKLIAIIVGVTGISVAIALVLLALRDNIDLYYTPQQALRAKLSTKQNVRLGGLVKKASVVTDKNTLAMHFVLTDLQGSITVYYTGVLPALFREGQGIVVEGNFVTPTVFKARQVLAKHDENYRPPGMK